jgi:hypothetical protein
VTAFRHGPQTIRAAPSGQQCVRFARLRRFWARIAVLNDLGKGIRRRREQRAFGTPSISASTKDWRAFLAMVRKRRRARHKGELDPLVHSGITVAQDTLKLGPTMSARSDPLCGDGTKRQSTSAAASSGVRG